MRPNSETDDSSSLDSSLEDEMPESQTPDTPSGASKNSPLGNKRLRLIGLAVIVLVVIITGLVIGLGKTKKPAATIVVNTQSLDAGTLSKLESQNKAGSVAQLTITPNTLFKNNVDVQRNLTVFGDTRLQGAATVGGSLTVGSGANVGGSLSVSGLITAGGLSVGTLTIASLHTNGDLVFGGHMVTTGSAPTALAGTSAGSGAQVSISGNDAAGTITITTTSASVAGELAQVNFHTAFKTAPHIQLTPLNQDSATAQYYVGRSATFFTVNTAAAPKSGTIYSYDYLVSQ